MCVHLALSPMTWPAVGWVIRIAVPSGALAETAPPTGMSASFASGPLLVAAPPEDAESPLEPQAATSVVAAMARPAPSTGRRPTVHRSWSQPAGPGDVMSARLVGGAAVGPVP